MSEIPALVRHDPGCNHARPDAGGHSDAAKRASDWYNLHVATGGHLAYGQWIAIALADGSSDGTLYASRKAAVAHQHHNESWFCFARIMPHQMTVCAAESFLYMHRMAYENGFRMTDPEAAGGGRALIPRITNEDHAFQLQALAARRFPFQRIG